jgi:AmiR/NasT family two-component response regulator
VPEPSEREQIEGVEAAGLAKDARIEGLEAAGLAKDEQIAALVEEVEHLHRAMEHRGVIEQAKGVIMSSMGCGPDAAFAVLVAQSQRENRKLREVAVELADSQERHPPST